MRLFAFKDGTKTASGHADLNRQIPDKLDRGQAFSRFKTEETLADGRTVRSDRAAGTAPNRSRRRFLVNVAVGLAMLGLGSSCELSITNPLTMEPTYIKLNDRPVRLSPSIPESKRVTYDGTTFECYEIIQGQPLYQTDDFVVIHIAPADKFLTPSIYLSEGQEKQVFAKDGKTTYKVELEELVIPTSNTPREAVLNFYLRE